MRRMLETGRVRGSQGRRIPTLAVCATLATLGWSPHALAQLPCRYEVDVVYGPQCGSELGNASGFGISDEGDICGEFDCGGGTPDAFVSWDAGALVPVGGFPPGTYLSRSEGIQGGIMCGHLESISLGSHYGFRWANGVGASLGTLPGGNFSEAYAIGPTGTIVGAWGHLSQPPLFPRAFRWQNGVMEDLSPDLLPNFSLARDINDNGAITGYMGLQQTFPNDVHAFIWENGTVTDLGLAPGSVATEGWGINNHNQVCGVAWFVTKAAPGFLRRGFLWDKGAFTDLGLLSGPGLTELQPRDISDDGTIVGIAGGGTGFVWKAGVLRRLSSLLPHNHLGIAVGINSSGEIIIDGHAPGPNPPGLENVAMRARPVFREPGDTNCDFVVNVDDLVSVIVNWNQTGVDADTNGSGTVDIDDLIIVILNWG